MDVVWLSVAVGAICIFVRISWERAPLCPNIPKKSADWTTEPMTVDIEIHGLVVGNQD